MRLINQSLTVIGIVIVFAVAIVVNVVLMRIYRTDEPKEHSAQIQPAVPPADVPPEIVARPDRAFVPLFSQCLQARVRAELDMPVPRGVSVVGVLISPSTSASPLQATVTTPSGDTSIDQIVQRAAVQCITPFEIQLAGRPFPVEYFLP